MKKVIISVAPVKASSSVDCKSLANDVRKSVENGASMCHLHCRKPNGELTSDTSYMIECFEEILRNCKVIVQASTGGISNLTIEERCLPLEYEKVQSTSLNAGSTNLGDAVYINSFEDIKYCSKKAYEKTILPEIEIFDICMINNMQIVQEEIPYLEPILYNLVFGHKGGMQPTIEALQAFVSFVPNNALWGVTHFGRDNWTFLAAAIAMGATVVRIGFEDSDFLNIEEQATYNYELVSKLSNLIKSMGLEVATVDEAVEILSIEK